MFDTIITKRVIINVYLHKKLYLRLLINRKGESNMKDINFYTKGEEIANAITHGVGAVLAVTAAVLLIVFSAMSGDPWKIVSFTIYGVTLIIMYLGSTLYHSIPNQKAKKVFRVIDHSSIYLLIAGSYTPFMLGPLRGSIVAIIILIVIWIATIVGIVFKAICLEKFGKLSTFLYILMGWAIVFVINDALATIPVPSLILLLIGGLCYTGGCIFFAKDEWPYNHAVWHLFVLAGSIFQFFAIILYL